MIVRFGYVANALALRDCSPSKTLTFTRWASMKQEERTEKLKEITLENIQHTLRILHYNIAHEIPLYRFSSSLVPLATHPEVQFDYIHTFQHEWKQIGNLVKEHTLRVSFHPNQFTLFTSDKLHITENALTSMTYHYNLLQAMGLERQTLINIHVGGAYGNKETATKRFFQNINMLPSSIKEQMTLENDDKTYTTEETVQICEKEHIPLVFDYHHHVANPSETPLKDLLPRIFATWTHKTDPPKIHLSSPKSEKEFRSHADYVDSSFIIPFLHLVKEIDQDIDVMIESKKKDLAFFQLMEDLSKVRGYKRIKGGFLSI